jgi:para-nitrobenzyl esterase
MSEAQIESYLRGRSTFEILEAYEPWESTGMISMPKVFRDGVVLPQEEPRDSLAGGRYNVVPTMIGTTRDENKLFMFGDPKWVRRTLWIFWRLRDERMYNLTAEYLATWWKADGADDPAAAMRTAQGPSVYVYRFDWDEEPTILGADLAVMLGAAHAFEIPFVFGHFDLGRRGNMLFTAENEPGRKELSAKMMSYWAAFAAKGDPNGGVDGDLTEWQAWDNSGPDAPKFLILDTQADGGVRMSSDSLTGKKVLADLEVDARLSSKEERCSILRALTAWGRALEEHQYDERCPEYPFDEHPES